MKKLIIKLSLFCCLLLMFFTTSTLKLSSKSDSLLIDFEFDYEEVYLHNQVKVKISFKTEESLSYLKVTTSLENGQEEVSFEMGRPNEGTLERVIPKNEGDLWQYYLTFKVENVQLGTLKMKLDYSFDITYQESYQDVFYVPAGVWVDTEEMSISVPIVGGIIILIFSLIGTYLIIAFSKTKVFYNENDQEEENN